MDRLLEEKAFRTSYMRCSMRSERKASLTLYHGNHMGDGTFYRATYNLASGLISSFVVCNYSFVVHKRKTFVECVMPVYFRMSKFVSFQRQLNLYGFNRITKGQDKGGKGQMHKNCMSTY
jgi:hypothetical protein